MITKYFRAFRIAEVLILTGFVLIGAVLSVVTIDYSTIADIILIFCIAFCSTSASYAFNAYQGRAADRKNERLTALGEISPSTYLVYFVIMSGISLLISYFLRDQLIYYVLVFGIIGVAYSIPGIGKDTPFGSKIIHALFQIAGFHIAYVVFLPPSLSSVLLSLYFSILYTAGHLHHEVIDYEADKESATKTGAVYLGIHKIERYSFVLFTCSAGYWSLLYFKGVVNIYELLPFLAAYCLHLVLYINIHGAFENDHNKRTFYRAGYRSLYFFAGLILIGLKFGGFN